MCIRDRLYLGAAALLVFGAHVVAADALSRVANAYYTVASRDPHLAAIGFVWNPLPSLLALPLIALKTVWPSLVQLGFAGNIVSALFLAGAAYQLHGLLLDLGLKRVLALGLTAVFVVQPMILYLGANGASEAIFLFFVMLAVRNLSAWLHRAELSPLITAGVALGCAYLTSYQALPAAMGALLLVGCVSYARSRGQTRPVTTAMADAVILGAPVVLAVGLWTVTTWLITGDPLLQFSSVYGTGSQIHALRLEGIDTIGGNDRILLAARRLLAVAPGLPAALLLTVLTVRQRDRRWLAPIAVMAPVLLVMFTGYMLGLSLPWLHFFGLAAPLAILLIGFALAKSPASRVGSSWPKLHATVAFAVLVGSLPISLLGMLDSSLAPKESIALRSVIAVARPHKPSPDWNGFGSSWAVARYLDAHQLPDASVMVDSFTGFPILVASANPRQFVITNDRDFPLALNDPAGFGVEYILVPSPKYQASLPSLDAVNRTYPALYASGANMATLVREFDDPNGRVDWRLYRVLVP